MTSSIPAAHLLLKAAWFGATKEFTGTFFVFMGAGWVVVFHASFEQGVVLEIYGNNHSSNNNNNNSNNNNNNSNNSNNSNSSNVINNDNK